MPCRCSDRGASAASVRVEDVAVDGVVDDMQLRLRQPKRSRISSRTIFELQITARSHGLAEQALLDAQHVAIVRRQRESKPRERGRALQALLEPHGVHAVAGAIDVAAEQALVRFDEVRLRPRRSRHDRRARSPSRARGARRSTGRRSRGSISCSLVCGHDRVYSEIATLRSSSASSARSMTRSAPPSGG